MLADGKAAQELQKRKGKLGMQPIAAGDVWQSRMSQDAWRMSRHECKRKAEFGSTEQGQKRARSNGDRRARAGSDGNVAQPKGRVCAGGKPRVFVAAENRLLREALSRMLVKCGNIDVAGCTGQDPFERKT